MRKLNRMYGLGLGMLLGTLLFSGIANAQQPLPWESTLENAQRLAAQNNRLVLIHFWAPWCGACKKMEAEVFNQPGVATALLANYVPVKINADQMPDTASKFGITGLPTDVVITPQGQVVDMIRGRTEAIQYVVRLNQLASARKTSAGQIAPVPANIPARTLDRPVAEQSAGGNQSAKRNSPADDRYADYYRRGQSDQGDQPLLSAATVSREMNPNPATISPPYGQQQPAIGSELSGPSLGPTSSTSGQQVQNSAMPQMGNPSQQVIGNPSLQNAANMAGQAPPISNQFVPPPAAYTAQQAGSAMNSFTPPTPNATQQVATAKNITPPPSAGNPAMCLDGFCPVSLAEKQQWVLGDRRWGAIHRGRTYLFTGPDEQRRFFGDPDRYAPVISGNDIIQAIERGQTVPGIREHGVSFNGHVFLFADEASLEKFSKNPAYYANQALEAIQTSKHIGQQMR